MERTDFVIQWLDMMGVELYNKGKRILEHDGSPGYRGIGPMDTKFEYGEEVGTYDQENESWTHMFWPELDSLGYGIKLDTNIVKWRSRQIGAYKIVKKTKNTQAVSYGTFKSISSKYNIVIQHDARNRRIRLVGENVLAGAGRARFSGVSDWVCYDDSKPRGNIYTPNAIARMKGIQTEESKNYVEIDGIPLMLTDEKYIVTMPRTDLPQRILVVGMSGMGKSLFVNSVAGRIFYKWQERVGWLLDPTDQLSYISLPQDNQEFNMINSWINDEPRPIPALLLYLACRYQLNIENPNISLILSLDFVEFLKRYKFFTYGMKDYDVGASVRYINQFLDDFKNVTEADQIREIMYKKIPGANKDKGMGAMIYKYVNTFESIFKQKYTSNLYRDDPKETHYLEARLKDGRVIKGHPFIVAMEAGTVPVLNIAMCRKERYVRNYMADLMQQIIRYQASKPKSDRNRLWVIADELGEIWEEGKTRDNASASFEELFRQGRPHNVGFVGNTQSLDRLNKEMVSNATHIVCVYIKRDTERRAIGKMFDVAPEVYNQLSNLKRYEIMVFTKEKFNVYDRYGKKRNTADRCWYKGRLFPPVNYHYVPKGK